MPAVTHAQVRVLLFGPAARAAGAPSLVVRVSVPSTAVAVLHALGTQHPALAFALPQARLAVNHALASSDTPVHEHDELALIALVDGG